MNRHSTDDPRVTVLHELAHPLRLRVVDRLAQTGPASASRLAGELGVAAPHLSNHLRRLRDAGLVSVERSGRGAVYSLADPGLARLLPVLDRVTGRVVAPPAPAETEFALARTCYDHLAGRLGVSLYRALRRRRAVRDRPDGSVELGRRAAEVFAALGVDPGDARTGRRRFAFECLDATERTPHLGGALGAALADGLREKRWIEPGRDARTIRVTRRGARRLRETLDIDVGPVARRS